MDQFTKYDNLTEDVWDLIKYDPESPTSAVIIAMWKIMAENPRMKYSLAVETLDQLREVLGCVTVTMQLSKYN